VSQITTPDFSLNKLGGPVMVVQVDETMLNYKCKSHRGQPPTNKTDDFCIVEVRGGIKRAFAKVIPGKRSCTLVPIIVSQFANGACILN
jgi:hypothetical protein